MRKHFTTIAFAALMGSISASTGTPLQHELETAISISRATELKCSPSKSTLLKGAPRRSAEIYDEVINEDFSKFEEGTPDEPDTSNILAYDLPNSEGLSCFIDPELTVKPGWNGCYVYSAGGTAALLPPDRWSAAYLNTPLGDYSGDLEITMRVKAMPNTAKDPYFMVNVLVGDIYHPTTASLENTKDAITMIHLSPDGTWSDVKIKCRNYSSNNDGFIQINSYSQIIVDYVIIKASNDEFMADPILKAEKDFSSEGFTASWYPVRRAYDYHVSLFRQDVVKEEDTPISCDFSDELPEEWQLIGTAQLEEGVGYDTSRGVTLHNGDAIICMSPGKMKEISAWLQTVFAEGTNPRDKYGYIGIVCYQKQGDEVKAYPLAQYNATAFMNGDTADISEEFKQAGYLIDDIYDGFGFVVSSLPEDAYVVVDDVNFIAGPITELVDMQLDYGYCFTDGETSYTFTNLDPEKEYFYMIKSFWNAMYSKGQLRQARGLEQPKNLTASDIDKNGSYTANWDKVLKADSYKVSNYGIFNATAEGEYDVLDEDFTKIDDSITSCMDINNPESLNNHDGKLSLDPYTLYPGWTGLSNTICQGYLGLDAVAIYTPFLATPPMDLGNDDNIVMQLSAYGQEGDGLVVEVPEGTAEIPFNHEGEIYSTFDLGGISSHNLVVKFTSKSGLPVMFESIKFSQKLEGGESVQTFLGSIETTDNFARFEDLNGFGFQSMRFSVASKRVFPDGETVYSDEAYSNEFNFESGSSAVGVTPITFEEASDVEYFTVDGIQSERPMKGINIVKNSNGTYRKIIVR